VAVAGDGPVPEGLQRDASREDDVEHVDVGDDDQAERGPASLLDPAMSEKRQVEQDDGDLGQGQGQGIEDDGYPFRLDGLCQQDARAAYGR